MLEQVNRYSQKMFAAALENGCVQVCVCACSVLLHKSCASLLFKETKFKVEWDFFGILLEQHAPPVQSTGTARSVFWDFS